jgi:hypothetical protein
LKVRYHRTQSTMISWSKCRPLKRAFANAGSIIPGVTAGYRPFQAFAPEPPKTPLWRSGSELSKDLCAEPLAGPWFRLGVCRGCSKRMLLSPQNISVIFDKLESIVGDIIGKPGGWLSAMAIRRFIATLRSRDLKTLLHQRSFSRWSSVILLARALVF